MASAGTPSLHALRFEREIDHHDGVLLHHAEQHDQPHEREQVQLLVEQLQRQQRAEHRRRQPGKNRDGVDEALVQNSENDVNRQNRHDQQNRHPPEAALEFAHRALEADADGGGHAHLAHRIVDRGGGFAQRQAGRQVEGDGGRGKLPEMTHR